MSTDTRILVVLATAVLAQAVVMWWLIRRDRREQHRLARLSSADVAQRIACEAIEQIEAEIGMPPEDANVATGIIAANVRAAFQGEDAE